jgi:hypothetical protein
MSALAKLYSSDQEEAAPLTIPMTRGMRRRLSALVESGLYGTTIEDAAVRLIAEALRTQP